LRQPERILEVKRQYLGDSKDSFKWDYHHYLVTALGYGSLTVAWMLTPDDRSGHGKTEPALFPAAPEILGLCRELRSTRNPDLAERLPTVADGRYAVRLHGSEEFFSHQTRIRYFDRLPCDGQNHVLFLDPDNGFEPPKHPNAKHVRYTDIERILDKLSAESVISVFHHFRRKRFVDDLADIRVRLGTRPTTAIYWRDLMFVAVSSSDASITRVRDFNCRYAERRPVKTLA
jgi:hypothetical protein